MGNKDNFLYEEELPEVKLKSSLQVHLWFSFGKNKREIALWVRLYKSYIEKFK